MALAQVPDVADPGRVAALLDLLADDDVTEQRRALMEAILATGARAGDREALGDLAKLLPKPGGSWVLDQPAIIPTLWGTPETPIWAKGEPLYIVGPVSTNKTVLSQNILLGLLGMPGFQSVIGYPVTPIEGSLMLLAMDRPAQARRSLYRMVGEVDREMLDERLHVFDGPPPRQLDPLAYENALVGMALAVNATVIVVDSAKDIAFDLENPSTGARLNAALQRCVAADIDVLVNHHPRKVDRSSRQGLKSLDDMFGGWLAAGAGSVVALQGTSGDRIVKVNHLKPVIEKLPPMLIQQDPETGVMSVHDENADLTGIIAKAGQSGVTANEAAEALYGAAATDHERRNNKERVRTRLNRMVDLRQATMLKVGGANRYYPVTHRPAPGADE